MRHQRSKARIIYLIGLWIILFAFSSYTILILLGLFTGSSTGRNLSSQDWAGYVVASDFTSPSPLVSSVSGSWIVPEVTVTPQDTFSAVWVGIGGLFDGTLIQAGTEQDSVGGQTYYSAWYELLPTDSISISEVNVSPGDLMIIAISLRNSTSNQWLIEVRDITNGQSYSRLFFYHSSRLSAEWIVERPKVDSTTSTLAYFNVISFTASNVVINGRNGGIGDFPFARVTMYNRANQPLVNVLPLSQKSTFSVVYEVISQGIFRVQPQIYVAELRTPHRDFERLRYLRALAFSRA
jgi:hypothetical protein